MATYFDGDTLQPTLIIQLVTPASKLEMLLLEIHVLYFKTLLVKRRSFISLYALTFLGNT